MSLKFYGFLFVVVVVLTIVADNLYCYFIL